MSHKVGLLVIYFFYTKYVTTHIFALLRCYAAMVASYRRFGTTYQIQLQVSSSPRIFLDCLALEDGTERLSRNVGKYQSMLHNTSDERGPHLHLGVNLESHKAPTT
jgi:hypothetical protein